MAKTDGSALTRDRALDGVKGIAILLVMLGHCIVLNGLDQNDPFLYDAIVSVQMPLFMLISGIAAGLSGLSVSKLPRRMKAYLIPFFSWFVVSFFLARIRAGLLHQPVELSVSGFFTELKELLFEPDRGLWFLLTVFMISLVATLSDLVGQKVTGSKMGHAVVTGGVSVLFYLLFFLQQRGGNTFLGPSLTLLYLPYFMLGFLVFVPLKERLKKKDPGAALLGRGLDALSILCGIGFLALVVGWPLAPGPGQCALPLRLLASLTGTVAVFWLCYRLLSGLWNGKKEEGKRQGVLALLGQYTLEIYVLHFRFARLLGIGDKGVVLYSLPGLCWLLLCFLLMSVLTALCIVVIRRIPPLSLLLFGKKRK